MINHTNENGKAAMGDIVSKRLSPHLATATCTISFSSSIWRQLKDMGWQVDMGNILEIARIAGIMAVKRAPELLPLCYHIPLESVEIDFDMKDESVDICCRVKTNYHKGFEIEALIGANIAALTIYDMCKSLGHEMSIGSCFLMETQDSDNEIKETH